MHCPCMGISAVPYLSSSFVAFLCCYTAMLAVCTAFATMIESIDEDNWGGCCVYYMRHQIEVQQTGNAMQQSQLISVSAHNVLQIQ